MSKEDNELELNTLIEFVKRQLEYYEYTIVTLLPWSPVIESLISKLKDNSIILCFDWIDERSCLRELRFTKGAK